MGYYIVDVQEYSVYFLALNSMPEGLNQSVTNIDFLSRIGLTANLGHAQSTNAGIRLQVRCQSVRQSISQSMAWVDQSL